MSRRGENIHYRTDGRWEARVVLGTLADGKTVYKSLYGKNYQEVKRKKESFLRENSTAISPASEREEQAKGADLALTNVCSFKEAAADWLQERKATIKESSYAHYTTIIKTHLLPAMGSLPLAAVTPDYLEAFFREKREHGRIKDGGPLSAKTISDLRSVLVQILRYAGAHGMIREVPACPSITSRPPAVSVLTRQEQDLLEQRLLYERTAFDLGVLLSLYGGLRIGEVCGLRWEDFDLVNATLHIHRTVMRIADPDSAPTKTKVVIGRPKTDCSIRTVPIPESIFAYVMQFRRADAFYVLTGREQFMEPRVCRERFRRLLVRAGIPHYSYHALRHTYATRCVESGVDLKSLSEIMGHSDIKITMQRYVHPSLDSKKKQINRLTDASDVTPEHPDRDLP